MEGVVRVREVLFVCAVSLVVWLGLAYAAFQVVRVAGEVFE